MTFDCFFFCLRQTPSAHVACTVEMVPVNTQFEVAVIDEIQMIRDPIRGWAWTRALLGVAAHEVILEPHPLFRPNQ